MIDRIRHYLEQNANQYVSGAQLSRQLGCSRNAIWKHIQHLRKEGYVFEAVPNKGYLLKYAPSPLQLSQVIQGLRTKRFGRKIHYFYEIDSTQKKAQELVAQGATEGEVILAETQTAGRGRMGRTWHSPPGKGIWMSIVFKPSIPVSFISQLSILVALAVCRAVRRVSNLDVGIKWPNDLFIHGKKVSGILLESSTEDERLRYVVAGIGISVNLKEHDFPEELRQIASSIGLQVGHDISREQLLQVCFQEIEELYDLFIEHGFTPIRSSWEAHSISLHHPIRIQQGTELIEGIAQSIDESGGLVITKHSGEQVVVYTGWIESEKTESR